jgi:hypothetical protein
MRRIAGCGAAIELGAISENGVRFTTLADPEGNKFDVAAA